MKDKKKKERPTYAHQGIQIAARKKLGNQRLTDRRLALRSELLAIHEAAKNASAEKARTKQQQKPGEDDGQADRTVRGPDVPADS